jgi:hypothetical protein
LDDQEEMFKNLQDLMGAVERGFHKFHHQLDVLNQEDVFLLFMELVDDIVAIEETLMDVLDKEQSEKVEFIDDLLGEAINKVVESYQEGEFLRMKNLIVGEVEREYKKFKEGIEKECMPYAVY